MLLLDMNKVELKAAGKLWSLADLQKEAGLAPNTLYRIRAGKTKPSAKTIGRVAAALQCDPAEIATIIPNT